MGGEEQFKHTAVKINLTTVISNVLLRGFVIIPQNIMLLEELKQPSHNPNLLSFGQTQGRSIEDQTKIWGVIFNLEMSISRSEPNKKIG